MATTCMIAFSDKSDSKIFWKYFVVSRIDTRGVCVAGGSV